MNVEKFLISNEKALSSLAKPFGKQLINEKAMSFPRRDSARGHRSHKYERGEKEYPNNPNILRLEAHKLIDSLTCARRAHTKSLISSLSGQPFAVR
ncbi:hypothetical protein CDAR_94011 [Caerostris darwini]|uniref:Uncharacterized protein n=1 Tax=Caerostris darwini TaxID=1538125 RepID=A0AAV4NJZ0_9ARAC|nr:hypothetical protein CDAR_94011 [Caerostris darwini]